MANSITKEEHERNKRRRFRQLLGAGLCLLIRDRRVQRAGCGGERRCRPVRRYRQKAGI